MPMPKTASKDVDMGQKQVDALCKLADIFQTALSQGKLTPVLVNCGSNMRQPFVQPWLPAVQSPQAPSPPSVELPQPALIPEPVDTQQITRVQLSTHKRINPSHTTRVKTPVQRAN
eukprot:11094488-Ditylum_brightwellii.AAC.1